VSQDGAEGQDEIDALFDALGGELSWDELTQMMGAGRCPVTLARQAAFLVGGDSATAEQVVLDSLTSLRQRGLVAVSEARVLLYRSGLT
jgi:hypothetical protein